MSRLSLSTAEYSQYENGAVIIADSIAISVSPDELFDNPEAYYYKPVAIKGEIERVVSPNAFTMEDDELTDEIFGSKDLLVVGVDPERVLVEDSGVVATGIVRPLSVSELELSYEVKLDSHVSSELAAKYEQPVLIMNGVYPLQD